METRGEDPQQPDTPPEAHLITHPPIATLAQTLPWGGEGVLVVGVVAGVLLWLLGSRFLKPAFAVLGMALGGFAGAVLLPITGLPAFDVGGVSIGPGVIGMVIGAIVGGLVAAGLFRVMITLSAGVVFAVVGVMGSLVYLHHTAPADQPPDEALVETIEQGGDNAPDPIDSLARGAQEMLDSADETLRDIAEQRAGQAADEQASEFLTDEQKEQLNHAKERAWAFIEDMRDAGVEMWEQRTPRERMVILGSMLAGLVAGLLAGVVFPKRVTALITALLGSAVWIFSAVTLTRTLTSAELAYSAQTWAVLWVGTTIIGLVLQLSVMSKRGVFRDDDDDDDRDEDDEDDE